MTCLITGGTGFIGSYLARIMVEDGRRPVLLDPAPPRGRLLEIVDGVDYVQADLGSLSILLNVMRDYGVDTVFHLGGMLSVPSDHDPWSAFEANVVGTYNALEAARLGEARGFIYASSIAVYGEGLPEGPAGDDSLERPTSMYGSTKVFGQLLGRFYARRFGLDFRAIRIPSVIGPGSRVPHMSIYNCWAIEETLKGNPYVVLAEPGTRCPAIYFKDAARALWRLANAPAEAIRTKVYNIAATGPAFSARELVDTVRLRLPRAEISFEPDPEIVTLIEHLGRLDLDDSKARQEWGWAPSYDLGAMVDDFIEEFNQHRDVYAG